MPRSAPLGRIVVTDLDGDGNDEVVRASGDEPWSIYTYPGTAVDGTCPVSRFELPDQSSIVAIDALDVALVGSEELVFALVRRTSGTSVEISTPTGVERGRITATSVVSNGFAGFVTYARGEVWFGGEMAVVVSTSLSAANLAPRAFVEGDPSTQLWYGVAPLRAASSAPVALLGNRSAHGATLVGGKIDLDRETMMGRCTALCSYIVAHAARSQAFDSYSVSPDGVVETELGSPGGLAVTQFPRPTLQFPLALQDATVEDLTASGDPDLLALYVDRDLVRPAQAALHADQLGVNPIPGVSAQLDMIDARAIVWVRTAAGSKIVVVGATASEYRCLRVTSAPLGLADCGG